MNEPLMPEPKPASPAEDFSFEALDKFYRDLGREHLLSSVPVPEADPVLPDESIQVDSEFALLDVELGLAGTPSKRSLFARIKGSLKCALRQTTHPPVADEALEDESSDLPVAPVNRWAALTDAVHANLPPGYRHLSDAFEDFTSEPTTQVRESRFYALFEEAASMFAGGQVEVACSRMVEAIDMAGVGCHFLVGDDLYLAMMAVVPLVIQSSQRPETIVYAAEWIFGNDDPLLSPALHRRYPCRSYGHRLAEADAKREHEILRHTLAASGVAKVATLIWDVSDFNAWTCNDLEAGVAALVIGYAHQCTSVLAVARGLPGYVKDPKLVEAELVGHGIERFTALADALGLRAGADSRTWALRKKDETVVEVMRRRTAAAKDAAPSGKPPSRSVTAAEPSPGTAEPEFFGGLLDSPSVSSAADDDGQHVVCKSPIVSGSERSDVKEIARHAALESPLPTKKMPEVESLLAAQQELVLEFPWAHAPIEAVFSELLTRARLGVIHLTVSPMLFVGAPGTGKSRLARRFAEVLALAHLDVFVAGHSDPKVLSGTSRGWSAARPSTLATKIVEAACASLLVLVDEIDKAFVHNADEQQDGGGIGGYLLGMLEPETACRQYDSFLMTNCDYSHVSWIFTANDLSNLPPALLGRVQIYEVPKPQPEHMEAIARESLRELEIRWRLPPGRLPTLDEIGGDWRAFSTPRGVRRGVQARVTKWVAAKAAADEAVSAASSGRAGQSPKAAT